MKRVQRYCPVALLPVPNVESYDQNSLQTLSKRDDTVIWQGSMPSPRLFPSVGKKHLSRPAKLFLR
jgi:hypothetical protein